MGKRRGDRNGFGGSGGLGAAVHDGAPGGDPGPISRRLVEWFGRNARDLPWRRTTDPYAIWVSEVMLQQTQVQTVIPYWTRWMERLPGVRELSEAPTELVLKLWEGLGYYSRARNLQVAARRILEDHGGTFPQNAAAMLALPGIGRYTAGAIASIALDQPEPILDGNVIRVLTRLFALGGDPRSAVLNRRLWDLAGLMVRAAHDTRGLGDRRCSRLNQALMELGATVCTPGERPDCPRCPLATDCVARRNGEAGRFPELRGRAPITPRFFATGIVELEGRYLLRLREATGVNRGFWEFPNWETSATDAPEAVLGRHLGVPVDRWIPCPDLRHHITRYRITQRVRHARLTGPGGGITGGTDGTWLWATPAELESMPLTSAHRKLARRIAESAGKTRQLSGEAAGAMMTPQ